MLDPIKTIPKYLKPVYKFVQAQEKESSLATTRAVQDTVVNLGPKAVFARSFADLAENSFLEIFETLIVYYGPSILGENLFRKAYSKKLSAGLKKLVSKPATELIELAKEKKLEKEKLDKLMSVKAAISVSALAIPILEYSLNFAKNLFTLKLFKQSNFNNIANLEKVKKEDSKQQQKVKENAKKHLKIAAGLFAGCLGLSAVILKGKNNKLLKQFSELILAPGDKVFKKDSKKAKTFNKYFSLDFEDKNGKLGLSRGQITACVLAGGFGYTQAAKERGKQNLLEVLFRYPVVGFYVITGSEMFENGFKSALKKAGKYKDVLDKDSNVIRLSKLTALAKELSIKNKTTEKYEYTRLFKQKATIVTVPFLFSLVFMGLFVSGVSRFFTKYRFDKEQAAERKYFSFGQNYSDNFKKKIA